MRISQLFRGTAGAQVPAAAEPLDVSAVCDDSRDVAPGSVFVAVPGEAQDGRNHADDAVAAGAVVIVSETPLDVPVPVVLVPDARIALAELAAQWHGHPADALSLVGITGTMGKTSVLAMLSDILESAGIGVGTIGSLGIRYEGATDVTPNTTPGSLDVQAALAGMVGAGARVMAMEVTSHALVQGRVHGLMYDVGVFTNLTMLEHAEYHGTFQRYLDAKLRFFEHLKPGSPIIFPAGDRAVRAAVRRHDGPRIACGGRAACVHVRRHGMSADGTRITLELRRPLPRLGRDDMETLSLPLQLRTLGRTNIANATLAAVAALTVGAEPDHVRHALAAMTVPPRRLEVVRRSGPMIIDDTVGHPDSITGVFEVARRMPHDRLHVIFGIRGKRGPAINGHDAEALSIWARQVSVATLVATSVTDTADERNRVAPEEERAFLDVLSRAGLQHTHTDTLADAVDAVAKVAGENDLVLLLGAQGMDAAAELMQQALPAR
jgi:UDP-N-acetylmuramoyl-L-alanyl-D-glutamate--2,6-diaminopimelate ligase